MTRLTSRRSLVAVLALVVAAGSFSGCRTLMGLLSGDLSLEDIDKDIKGIAALSAAAREANKKITPEDEYWLGRAVAVSVLDQNGYRYLEQDQLQGSQLPAGITNYIYHVGRILVAAAERSPAKDDRMTPVAGYHFLILQSDEVNAFAAPGGFIFLTTGLLRITRTEDEVAAVLAHEMAHVFRGHGIRTIQKARWNRVKGIFASEAAGAVFGDQSAATEFLNTAVSDILERMVREGYSQKAELEADWAAMRLLAVSGYNPWALYNVIKAMDAAGHGSKVGFYKTHPSAAERMKALYKITPKTKYPTPPPARMARYRVAMGVIPPTGQAKVAAPADELARRN